MFIIFLEICFSHSLVASDKAKNQKLMSQTLGFKAGAGQRQSFRPMRQKSFNPLNGIRSPKPIQIKIGNTGNTGKCFTGATHWSMTIWQMYKRSGGIMKDRWSNSGREGTKPSQLDENNKSGADLQIMFHPTLCFLSDMAWLF